MQAVQLEGRAAQVATLRAGLGIASLRAKHATSAKVRATESALADSYRARLRALGEEV